MDILYPAIEPYLRHSFAVAPPHQLHIEECGNPSGIPVVFLHGGPGAGIDAIHRRFFDPQRYRIILFDQHGCGRSQPHAELTGNDTQALVSDIEHIRTRLDIDRWLVFGGSWGSTLALTYAETYPERVLGMVLRGIFLCRERDIRWFYQEGASFLFPDYWEDYLRPVALDQRDDMLAAYYRLLTGDDEVSRMAAAKAWSIWEARTASLVLNPSLVGHFSQPFTALALARIECHYFINQAFLKADQLLDQAHRLAGIPGVIIHGRYDSVCPLEQAWLLHQAWPEAELRVIPDAGHAATEPAIARALVEATDRMAGRLAGVSAKGS
jgi:proline iminopeptidase